MQHMNANSHFAARVMLVSFVCVGCASTVSSIGHEPSSTEMTKAEAKSYINRVLVDAPGPLSGKTFNFSEAVRIQDDSWALIYHTDGFWVHQALVVGLFGVHGKPRVVWYDGGTNAYPVVLLPARHCKSTVGKPETLVVSSQSVRIEGNDAGVFMNMYTLELAGHSDGGEKYCAIPNHVDESPSGGKRLADALCVAFELDCGRAKPAW